MSVLVRVSVCLCVCLSGREFVSVIVCEWACLRVAVCAGKDNHSIAFSI